MKQFLNKIKTVFKILFKSPTIHNTENSVQPETGWKGNIVTCDICTNSWLAVYHQESEKLECPNCNYMTNFEEGGLNV